MEPISDRLARIRRYAKRVSSAALLLFVPYIAVAHPEARNISELAWDLPNIAHSYAMGYTQLGPDADYSYGSMKQVGNRLCAIGSSFGFDIEDSYAFDIDEAVELTITYVPVLTSNNFMIAWDQNGGEGHGLLPVRNSNGETSETVTVTLDRARFAGQGSRGIDFAVSARNGQVAICDVKLERSGTTRRPAKFGAFTLRINDDTTGLPVPARCPPSAPMAQI